MGDFPANAIFQRNENVVSSHIDGEIVMMSVENGKYYGMDSIGSRIWKLLDQPTNLPDICDTLMNEYNVDATTCLEDVTEYMEQLIDEKLVNVAGKRDEVSAP